MNLFNHQQNYDHNGYGQPEGDPRITLAILFIFAVVMAVVAWFT